MTDTFDAETIDQIELILDVINSQYADTFAFVSRWAEADDAITSANLLTIDPRGADAEVTTEAGTRAVRLDFGETILGLEQLEHAMFGLLEQARAARPTDPLTSIELQFERTEHQPTHRCTILAVEELNERLRAFTVGPVPGWVDLGGDQSMTLFLDLPGRPIPDDIRLSTFREMHDDVRPKGATYSIRRHDPDRSTVEVWVVLHGDDPHTIGGWAADATVGDAITLWGPRRAGSTSDRAQRFLGVCDETGLAATLAIVDELDPGVPVDLVVEVTDAEAEFQLTQRDGVTVHWCHRGTDEPGTGTRLLDRVRELVTERDDAMAAFGASESRAITAVRKYLRRELDMPASAVSLTGYWRRAK
ncbi:MAG: siderophore-interacting protein [Actinomycetota bacterium]